MKKEIIIDGQTYILKEEKDFDKMTIKEQNLECGATSEEELNWDEAKEWCKKQGEGWRLPTRLELLEAYEQKIKGFTTSSYWSSTEGYSNNAWYQDFYVGNQYTLTKKFSSYVRCIRSI